MKKTSGWKYTLAFKKKASDLAERSYLLSRDLVNYANEVQRELDELDLEDEKGLDTVSLAPYLLSLQNAYDDLDKSVDALNKVNKSLHKIVVSK